MLGRTNLECIDLLGISQQQIYKDLSATLFPGVSFSNPGYNSLSAGMFETAFGVSVSDKVYENMSDIVYPGVSFSVLVNDAGYGRSGVYATVSIYLIIYKYGLKHYLWKVKFSDDCLKKKICVLVKSTWIE